LCGGQDEGLNGRDQATFSGSSKSESPNLKAPKPNEIQAQKTKGGNEDESQDSTAHFGKDGAFRGERLFPRLSFLTLVFEILLVLQM